MSHKSKKRTSANLLVPVIKEIQYTFQGDNSVSHFASLLNRDLLNKERDYSTRKTFARTGRKFFPCGVNPFQKGIGVQESKQEDTKVVSLVRNGRKFAKCIQCLEVKSG